MRLFKNLGYDCLLTEKHPTEAGADIIARKGDEIKVIQCKHTSKQHKQGREAFRQLIAEAKCKISCCHKLLF